MFHLKCVLPGAGRIAQEVEHLPCNLETLLNLSTAEQKTIKKRVT
jgi:hypothetical protein